MESNKKFRHWRHSLPATIYVLVYTIWTLANSFSLSLSIVRASYCVFYAMSLFYILKLFSLRSVCKFIRVLTLMYILVSLYGLALIAVGPIGMWKGTINAVAAYMLYVHSVIPVFVFYYFARKGMISFSWFQFITIFFIINACALYYSNRIAMLNTIVTGSDIDGFTNNSAYAIVSLIPLVVFFQKNSFIQFTLLIFISIFTIMCFKRGAILVLICAVAYFVLNMNDGGLFLAK